MSTEIKSEQDRNRDGYDRKWREHQHNNPQNMDQWSQGGPWEGQNRSFEGGSSEVPGFLRDSGYGLSSTGAEMMDGGSMGKSSTGGGLMGAGSSEGSRGAGSSGGGSMGGGGGRSYGGGSTGGGSNGGWSNSGGSTGGGYDHPGRSDNDSYIVEENRGKYHVIVGEVNIT